jgi:ariadne-1
MENQQFEEGKQRAEKEEEASMKLIQELNMGEVEQRRQEKEVQNEDLFKCQVCFDDYNEQNIMPLEACDHIFHMDCVKMYLQTKIEERATEIKCPDQKCKEGISMADMMAVLEEDQLEKYYKYTLSAAIDQGEGMSWCPSPDCNYAFSFQKGADSKFTCK